jgi:hypothetical protein
MANMSRLLSDFHHQHYILRLIAIAQRRQLRGQLIAPHDA